MGGTCGTRWWTMQHLAAPPQLAAWRAGAGKGNVNVGQRIGMPPTKQHQGGTGTLARATCLRASMPAAAAHLEQRVAILGHERRPPRTLALQLAQPQLGAHLCEEAGPGEEGGPRVWYVPGYGRGHGAAIGELHEAAGRPAPPEPLPHSQHPVPAHRGRHIVVHSLADLQVDGVRIRAAVGGGGLARHAAHNVEDLGGQPPRKLGKPRHGAGGALEARAGAAWPGRALPGRPWLLIGLLVAIAGESTKLGQQRGPPPAHGAAACWPL